MFFLRVRLNYWVDEAILRINERPCYRAIATDAGLGWSSPLADSGGGGAQGARAPLLKFQRGSSRRAKEGARPLRRPLLKFQRGSSNGTAVAPPLSTNPGSAPGHEFVPLGHRRPPVSGSCRHVGWWSASSGGPDGIQTVGGRSRVPHHPDETHRHLRVRRRILRWPS